MPEPIILEPLLSSGSTGTLLGPGGYPISTITPAEQVLAQFASTPRALPAPSNRVYNNPGMSRRITAQSRLGSTVPGSTRAQPGPTPFGSIGPRGNPGATRTIQPAGRATGVADDVGRAGRAAGGRAAAQEGSESLLRRLATGARQQATAPITVRGNTILSGGKGAGLVRGAGGLAAGVLASSLLDQFNVGGEGSMLDQLVTNVGGGAAGGAVFGGGLPGALVGGGLGLAGTLFGMGGGKTSAGDAAGQVREAMKTQLLQVGIDRSAIDKALKRFDADLSSVGQDDVARTSVVQQYAGWFDEVYQAKLAEQGNPVAEMLGVETTAPATSASAPTPEDMIAMQAIIAKVMEPYTQGMIDQGNAQSAILNQYAGKVGGAEGDWYRLQASQTQAGNQRLAAAYAMQAQLAPQMMQLEQARQASYQQPAAEDDWGSLIAGLTQGQ